MSEEKIEIPKDLDFLASVVEATPEIKPEETPKDKVEIESPLVDKKPENKEHLNTDDNSFKTLFPEFNSPDEIKAKIKEREEFESRVKDYEAKVLELEKDLEYHKSQNPFNDEVLFKLDKLKQSDPDNYQLYTKLAFGGISPIEIIKMKMIKDNPALKDKKPEVLDAIINKQYKIDAEEGDEDYEVEKEIRDAKLMQDSELAKKELMKPFDSIEYKKGKSAEELKKEQTEAAEKVVSGWRPKFKGIVEGFFRSPEPMKIKDSKGEVIFEFKPDLSGNVDEDIKLYGELASNQILGNGIAYSDEAEKDIKAFIENLYIIKNIDKIVAASIADAEEKARVKYSNPNFEHNKDKKPGDLDKEQQELSETISDIKNKL